MNTARALSNAREWVMDRLTPAILQTKLRAMATMLNFKPSMRHHLRDLHPVGVPFEFKARLQFITWDGKVAVHLIFKGGKMRVGNGKLENPDLTVRLKSPEHLRRFFTPGADTLGMLLENNLTFDGNMSYLFKFGHMSNAVTTGNKTLVPKKPWADSHGPVRFQDLNVHPAGEPCPERPTGEATELEDPYLSKYTLDDFPRVKRLLWAHRVIQPEICTERPRLITEFMLKHQSNGGRADPVIVRQAKALEHILTHKLPILHDDDLLAGTTTSRRIGVVIYPECGATEIWPELLTVEARELNPYRISKEDIEILDRQVFPFWMENNIREWARRENHKPRVMELDERFVLYFMWKTQAVSHTIMDLPMVLKRGLIDIQREARDREQKEKDPKRRAFYQALQIALSGVMDYARRCGLRARELLDQTEVQSPEAKERREILLQIAKSCEKVPAKPAETLREAIQATWILFLSLHQESRNAGLSLGRLDSWYEPYFQRDLQGVADPDEKRRKIEEAIELVCALMLKATDHLPLVPNLGNILFGGSSSSQVITLGGVTPEGKSAVCDMTWIFLKAAEMLRLHDPNMNARYHPGVNSKIYLRRLCEVNRLTGATPSLHNDQAVLTSLLNQGFPIEHARDWSATGCVEPTMCGRHFGHTNSMMFNMVAPLEMALYDGAHPLLDEQVGPSTGDPRSFKSYPEFLEAYKAQLGWLIDRSVEANNLLGRAHQKIKPTPLLSALFTGPMEKGEDVIDGGALYNSSGTAMVGLTDVVDSLCTIKTLIYGRKQFDFDTLLRALESDFVGHESLLTQILHKTPKFGQDQDLPREIAKDLMDFIYQRFQSHRNYRGGKYVPGYWSMSNHVAFGTLSSALPSGRRRGKAFTPGLTPAPLSGAALTDQIRTVADLNPLHMPNNIAFNVKVVPGAHDSHKDMVDRMTAYVASYFELGGMQMQFNAVSTDTLRAAMEHPEEYRDLIVRISGYNAYFVNLNKDIQQELIERTEHSLGR